MQLWIVQRVLFIGIMIAALIVVWAALTSMKKRHKILLTATVLSTILLIAAYILHVKSGYPMQMWIVQGILLIGVIAAALIVVWAALPSMKKRSKILLTATVLSAIILFLAFILYMAFGG